MLSESLRERIALLRRSALRPVPESRQPPREPDASRPGGSLAVRSLAGPGDARIRRPFAQVVPAGSEVRGEAGTYCVVDRPARDLLPKEGAAFEARYLNTFDGLDKFRADHDPFGTFEPLRAARADTVLFVDIEATGFTAGTPLFLIGVLHATEGALRVRQFLARDYTEEAPLLHGFAEVLRRAQGVLTFNGKTYDLPYIRERMVCHGIPFSSTHIHIDLLHEGRRRFRGRLPNCRLQTLERAICRRGRTGDIPGAEIPDAYHRFVRTGNASEMAEVIAHNAMDLVTLAQVVLFMLEGGDL